MVSPKTEILSRGSKGRKPLTWDSGQTKIPKTGILKARLPKPEVANTGRFVVQECPLSEVQVTNFFLTLKNVVRFSVTNSSKPFSPAKYRLIIFH